MKGINNYFNFFYHFLIMIFLISAFLSCLRKEDSYIISKEDSSRVKEYKKIGDMIILPPEIITGNYNILIGNGDTCYYYSNDKPLNDEFISDDIQLIDLRYIDVIKIPFGCEREMIYQNIVSKKSISGIKAVVIASVKDTVNNPIVPYLLKLKSDTSNHLLLWIRRAIKDEKVALAQKFSNTNRTY